MVTLIKQIDVNQLRKHLTQKFPSHKVKSSRLNENVIMIQKGGTMVIITFEGHNLKIAGTINFRNFGIVLGIFLSCGVGLLLGVIGVLTFLGYLQNFGIELQMGIVALLTFIGGFLFLGIVWLVQKESIKNLENEVCSVIKEI